jgi:hypothetical protein
MDPGAVVLVHALTTQCGWGIGLAVCPTLRLLVTSDDEGAALRVFSLPDTGGACAIGGTASGLVRLCTLGGASSPAPMRFKFSEEDGPSGSLAFTGPTTPGTSRLLLVTDHGQDAVHVIDVVDRAHVGYVAVPGTIAGPRGVAARGSLVAVSTWKNLGRGDHVVRLFQGSGTRWTAVRVLADGFGGPGSANGQLSMPIGLRFTGDGTALAVAEWGNNCVSLFRVEDGSFVRHVATGLGDPYDVEECEGGWWIACRYSHTLDVVCRGLGCGGAGRLTAVGGGGDGMFQCPTAVTWVAGLGLAVREDGFAGRVQFFTTPDVIAMESMSPHRVGWMVAVARAAALS